MAEHLLWSMRPLRPLVPSFAPPPLPECVPVALLFEIPVPQPSPCDFWLLATECVNTTPILSSHMCRNASVQKGKYVPWILDHPVSGSRGAKPKESCIWLFVGLWDLHWYLLPGVAARPGDNHGF